LAAAERLAAGAEFDAVYVTNFGCGPDSFLTGFFQRALGKKPALLLEIDEHSADAGVITRLEAWLESLANVKFVPEKRGRLFPQVIVREDRTLYIPHMCEHAHAMAAAFRSVGVPSEALAPSDEESIQIGRRYTLGKECLPAIMTTGDMVRKLGEPGIRADRSAFFMPSGTGPCRFGQYHKLHRLVLSDIGKNEAAVFSPTQGRNFYQEFRGISGDPSRAAWQGMAAVDLLMKALHETRPYETRRGETDGVFQASVNRVCAAIEEGYDPLEALKDCARDFAAIPADRPRRKPLVGVVGEIYVRHSEAANNSVIRRLEDLGLEVELASFCEWVFYTNHIRRRSAFVERNFPDLFLTTAKDTVQRFDERRLGRPFRKLVRHTIEPPSRLLMDVAGPYIHDSFEGEATLTIAKSLEFHKENASGIVNVMPFTCMPGTITSAILRRVHKEHDLFPILNVAFDGQEDVTYQTRLEAFAHQVRQYHDARRAGTGRAVLTASGAPAR
jgi:predicted nucleotide-binding protein (sugar kinase/HSP70/actin superfamily)